MSNSKRPISENVGEGGGKRPKYERSDSGDGFSAMERPTLLGQIRAVLREYPDDGQILKELIQNAEDADATDVKILLDSRNIPAPKDLRPDECHFRALKAPAVCVYNDAQFTQEDWKGIRQMHMSIKVNKPLKVGRFGLGFKSVFHITDYPCIISGHSLLIISPIEKEEAKVCYKIKLKNLPNAAKEALGNVLSNNLGFQENDLEQGYFDGTLFWFPLRTEITEDSVVPTQYNDKKVLDLFSAFRAEASIVLLFLKSVDSIELLKRKKSDRERTLFSVYIKHDDPEQNKKFTSKVEDYEGKIAPSPISTRRYITVIQKESHRDQRTETRWLVVSFYKGGAVSDKLLSLCADPSLSYSPYVGIAVPLKPADSVAGQVFCFLPLPMEKNSSTGLKVHINGFFALSQNRRHVKWPPAEQAENQSHTDKDLQWNQCLIEEVLPEAYSVLIEEVISFCVAKENRNGLVQMVYSLLPNQEEVKDNWKPLATKVYSLLAQSCKRIFYTPNNNGTWIHANDAVFLNPTFSEDLKKTMKRLYTDYKRNSVHIKDHLYKTFQSITNMKTVTPQNLSALLSSDRIYQKLDRSKKLTILQYLLTTKPEELVATLGGLYLLPVADGSFSYFRQENDIFVCEDQIIKLFPRLEGMFLSPEVETTLWEQLDKLALSGILGLKPFTPACFQGMLKKCLNLHFDGDVKLPNGKLTLNWLEKLWTYIIQNNLDVSKLHTIPLIPEELSPSDARLWKLNDSIIALHLPQMTQLPKNLSSALQKLKVTVVSNVPSYIQKTTGVLGKFIHYPTREGINKLLGEFSSETMTERITNFNNKATREEKCAVINFLGQQTLTLRTKVVLKKLSLFATSQDKNLNMCIERLCQIVPEEEFPVMYPFELLTPDTEASKALAFALEASVHDLEAIMKETLEIISQQKQKTYTEEDTERFMMFLITKHSTMLRKQNTLNLAKEVRFLSSEKTNSKYRACELFDPNDQTLRALFADEDLFPVETQLRKGDTNESLFKLGLKRKNEVKEEDLCKTILKIESLYTTQSKKTEPKAKALLQFLGSYNGPMSQLRDLLQKRKCIPCITSQLDDYPKWLKFFNKDKTIRLESANNVYSMDCLKLVGSVASVAEKIPNNVQKQFCIGQQPPVDLVLKHLRVVTESYAPKENANFLSLLDSIYNFLGEQTFREEDLEKTSMMECIWTGMRSRFKSPNCVYLEDGELDLSPYRFQLPAEQAQHRKLLLKIGCHEDQNALMLVDVLHEIRDQHNDLQLNQKINREKTKRDLKIVTDILAVLKDTNPQPEGIVLPIHVDGDQLLLKPVDKCTYCDAEWLKDQMDTDEDEHDEDDNEEDDNFFYVHRDISNHTAKTLGVQSLEDRELADTVSLDMNFGQKEPLTRRLKNILEGYSDGFSVPKEILQNADDAGATKVKFLYDERENNKARTCLIHAKMASLHGPALWAYNNAEFSPDDFDNITKLSGATKASDETKVGRFGLGFNAVYNITDVPSFISGNTFVIFDPHETFLGKPGIRADLASVKNKRMLKKRKGQFKPFEGIFGCHFDCTSSRSICPGTLFRFPLRTKLQAAESQISRLSYDPDEMKCFIKAFAEGAGNLLLFTQHVTTVEFYHMKNSSKDKDEPTLLLEVTKNNIIKEVQAENCEKATLDKGILDYVSSHRETKNVCILERHVISKRTNRNYFLGGSQRCSMSWHITWKSGEGPCEQLAKSGKLQGLLPLAAVAIPMKSENKGFALAKLHQCKDGFYDKGHLFCFLPLPIGTPFPVHINASFALTSNRKNLCSRSEDDKGNPLEAQWNEALATDAIPLAYIACLETLENINEHNVESYYELWPKDNKEELSNSIIIYKSFYKEIIQNPRKVFIEAKTSRRISFQDGSLLDPELRFHKQIEIRNIAYQSFLHFSDEEDNIMDIPKVITRYIRNSGQGILLNKHIISQQDFFRTMFLPNLLDTFWDSGKRDVMVMYMLENPDLKELLKFQSCIPTIPNGKLKKPADLVHPSGKASDLYCDDDEVFPLDTFKRMFSTLCELGMIEDDLPCESIVERSKTVTGLGDLIKARERSLNIISYLSQKTEMGRDFKRQRCGYRYETYPDELRQRLIYIPFLAILEKPKLWPFIWAGTGRKFQSPSELYFEKTANLVSTEKCILLNDMYLSNTVLLKWLGVKGKSDVELKTVLKQLCTVSNLPSLQHVKDVNLQKIFDSIYLFLNQEIQNNYGVGNIIKTTIREQPVLLVGKKTVSAQKFAFELKLNLRPYLYYVDWALIQYKDFLSYIGVRQRFDISDGISVLKEIARESKSQKLSEEKAKCFGRVTYFINELMTSTHVLNDEDIRLIDSNLCLNAPSSLCINDCEWLPKKSSMKFLCRYVNETVARKLGVKSKREVHLGQHKKTLFKPFGQKEKLTNRLRRILTGYPCDSSVMKELLQNADDAKASELIFIMDFRSHPSRKVFSKEWSALQGPALCVYNDSYFKEEDFQGIQQLGEGSKSEDPVQTGQYGVGFNAVYHLTDAPSFLTFGPETEKTLCILDPTLKYIPDATNDDPGARYEDLSDLEHEYPDVFSCYDASQLKLKDRGTLFRFPLRKKSSEIKTEILLEDDVISILELFQNDMLESLLFLQNVRKICVNIIDSKGKLSKLHEVKITVSDTDNEKLCQFQKCQKRYASKLKEHPDTSPDENYSEVQIVANIWDSRKRKNQKWLIIHRIGLPSDAVMPADLTKNRHKVGLLPRGGIAVPLSTGFNFKAKAFCVLPLPLETGLPMHVNGHFALDYETRRNLWNGNDYRKEWNDLIVQWVIVPAYLSAIVYFRDNVPETQKYFKKILDEYHILFPHTENATNDVWKSLMQHLYTVILEKELELFPVLSTHSLIRTVSWVGVRSETGYPGYFNTIHLNLSYDPVAAVSRKDYKGQLKIILKDIGMKVLETPLRILIEYQKYGFKDDVKCVTPKAVTHYLKSHRDFDDGSCHIGNLPEHINTTQIKSVENFICLLRFCLKDESFLCDLDEMPLALNQEGTFNIFDINSPLVITPYHRLITGSAECVLHSSLYNYFHLCRSPCLRRMDIPTFASLLSCTLDINTYKVGKPIPWHMDVPSEQWIIHLWDFLTEEKAQLFGTSLIVEYLNEWNLIPTKLLSSKGYDYFLYPVEEGKKVLNIKSIMNGRLSVELQRLPIPQLWFEETSQKQVTNKDCVVTQLVADENHPESILFALASANLADHVQDNEGILEYFRYNLHRMMKNNKSSIIDLLRKLPIFRTVSNALVSIEQCRCVYAMENHFSIPAEGMALVSKESNTTIIWSTDESKSILSAMQIENTEPTKLYVEIILPHFNAMKFSEKIVHLVYIRENILYQSDNSLIQMLKSLKFIRTQDGQFLPACSFYDSDNAVFKVMCTKSAFPTAPFNETKWKNFLKAAGLQCKITTEKFVEFAKQVEKTGELGLTENVMGKSTALLSYLSTKRYNFEDELLLQIKAVKFILPYRLEEDSDTEGKQLVKIHKQPEHCLVSFCESVSSEDAKLIWTTCRMFTVTANQILNISSKNLLGISDKPCLQSVINHIQNVTSSPTMKSLTETAETSNTPTLSDVVKDVMTSFYKYLQDNGVSDDTKAQLQDYCTIYFPEEGYLLKAEEIVTEMRAEDEIRGYIEKAPVYFGQFFDVFHSLGAACRLNIKSCVKALKDLHAKTAGQKLHPNELQVVEKSFKLLTKCLVEEKDQWNVQCLYLPNEEGILMNSSILVAVDKVSLKDRVKSLSLQYLMDFEKLPSDFHEGSFMKYLMLIPDEFRPSLLTSVVTETISPVSKDNAGQGEMSKRYKNLLTGELVSALVRLVHHVHCGEEESTPVLTGSQIEERIEEINIVEVPGLQSILMYKGSLVPDSEADRNNLLDTSNDSNRGILYLNADEKEDDVDHTLAVLEFAALINMYLDHCLKDKILVIDKMLHTKPKDLQRLLDGFKIKSSDFKNSLSEKPIYPPLGSFVDKEFHWMLENSFTTLDIGEYVAVEIFDPSDDNEDEDADSDPLYIYAKVKQMVDSDVTSAMLRKYLLDIGKDTPEEVPATKIYKFCREKLDTGKEIEAKDQTDSSSASSSYNLESVLEEIRKTLKEAWSNFKDQKDRDRVKRRLYLQWHPDKNPGREELCNEVCKMIQIYVRMLDKGEDIDNIKSSDRPTKSSWRRSTDPWSERMDRRSRNHRSYYQNYRETHRDFSSHETFYTDSSDNVPPQPQPREAKRWLKQAKADLDAAKESRTSRYNNWTCFKCQQAAEKSIKAMWYNVDSRRADRLRNHNLARLAVGLGHTELLNLASQLDTVIVDFNRLRYPDRLSFPSIPADHYTRQNAETAENLAEKIVSFVEGKI